VKPSFIGKTQHLSFIGSHSPFECEPTIKGQNHFHRPLPFFGGAVVLFYGFVKVMLG
jgi:hypothetical protein